MHNHLGAEIEHGIPISFTIKLQIFHSPNIPDCFTVKYRLSYDSDCKPLLNSNQKRKKKERKKNTKNKIRRRNIQKASLNFSANDSEKFPSGLRLCGQVSTQFNPLSDFDTSLELKERSNLNCLQMSNPKNHCYSTPNLVCNGQIVSWFSAAVITYHKLGGFNKKKKHYFFIVLEATSSGSRYGEVCFLLSLVPQMVSSLLYSHACPLSLCVVSVLISSYKDTSHKSHPNKLILSLSLL